MSRRRNYYFVVVHTHTYCGYLLVNKGIRHATESSSSLRLHILAICSHTSLLVLSQLGTKYIYRYCCGHNLPHRLKFNTTWPAQPKLVLKKHVNMCNTKIINCSCCKAPWPSVYSMSRNCGVLGSPQAGYYTIYYQIKAKILNIKFGYRYLLVEADGHPP